MNFKVKVCGMREPENILEVSALSPDFLGFIFYEKSPRYVGMDFQIPVIKKNINKVGVFVNHDFDFIMKQVDRLGLNHVQLHGHETPALCEHLRSDELKVIKVLSVDPTFDFKSATQYADHIDYFLFDTKSSSYGGTGKTFDWSLLRNYRLSIPFFLSGGLNPENIGQINTVDHKLLYAIDLNSGVESIPGRKDISKLKSVLIQINQPTKV
jgi:phosphoribosylanthranilate isomerase